MDATPASTPAFDPARTTRPAPVLLRYYLIVSALTIVGFPFVFLPLYFKYHTLKYAFDEKGVSMSWGILFRREIYLTYRRIQDIHVSRNIIQRWQGLASVAVQTASGSAGAEMTIEGILQPEALRDFLYAQMRGARGDVDAADAGTAATAPDDEAIALLTEIRDALKGMRTGGEA
jgi:putative membrane protein